MKICFFIGSTTGGGAEHVVCELASFLAERGHQASILTVSETSHSYPISPKVELDTIDTAGRCRIAKVRLLVKMLKLRSFIKRSDADCFAVFLPDTIRAFMFFRKLVKAPVILAERNNPSSYSTGMQKKMLDSFGKADGLVFQTDDAQSFYARSLDPMPVSIVIPNAIPDGLPVPYVGLREKIVVGVGRFNEQKNFPLLIRAFAEIAPEYPEFKLRIYGDGALREDYMKLAEECGISGKLEMPGFVDAIPDKIRTTSLFVLSSDYEGMPNALMEAMAVGLPCISTDCPCGGPSFLIRNGENGILVPANDVDAMANAMRAMLANQDKADEMGKAAAEIRNTLAEDAVFSRWEDFFVRIAGKC